MQPNNEDFKKKREEFAINIRRNNREEAFNKNRNFNNEQDPESKSTKQLRSPIVDSRYKEQIQQFFKLEFHCFMLPQLVKLLNSPDVLDKHKAVIGIRKIISSKNFEEIEYYIDFSIVTQFLQLLEQKQFPQLKFQSLWTLTNVAQISPLYCEKLVKKGCIPIFVKLLHESQKLIKEQTIWLISNIAADKTLYRDMILQAGGLQQIIQYAETAQNENSIKISAWAISNLCRGKPQPHYQLVKDSMPILAQLIINNKIQDPEVLSDCLWTISYLCEGSVERIQVIIDLGFIQQCFKLSQENNQNYYTPCLRIIGNISLGSKAQANVLFENGIIDLSLALLNHPKRSIRREISWIMSNLVAGTESQLRLILEREDLLKKISVVFSFDVPEVSREICWFFGNMGHIVSLRARVVEIFVRCDIVRIFVNLITEEDTFTLENVLNCLYKVLLIGQKALVEGKNLMLQHFISYQGYEKLEHLLLHKSEKVSNKSSAIIERFFGSHSDMN